jgi:hypothetical protein
MLAKLKEVCLRLCVLCVLCSVLSLSQADWIKAEGANWTTEIHKKGLRWTPSWDADSDAAFAALHDYMNTPPSIVACRNTTVWPQIADHLRRAANDKPTGAWPTTTVKRP